MTRQARSLFDDSAEIDAFTTALLEGTTRGLSILVLEEKTELGAFPKMRALPWQPEWAMRLREPFRPGAHPLHAKGAYYSLDFSSVFAASAMLAIKVPPVRVLDVCASPGGKSVFAWRAFLRDGDPESRVLICNETIRKRCGTLIENLKRCKIAGSSVGSADPSVWAKKAAEQFDLVLVDAPCSGQSLLAKGEVAEGCFHPTMIDMNVSRQRRIVGNAVHCIRPGGHLLYMTCTFSKQENEKLIAWVLREHPFLEAVEVPELLEHRSTYADFPCYRLFPQSGLGAGAFSCLLRHTGEPPAHREALEELPLFWRAEF
jgi:16S rRNA C967 or C1407 C5-methylase (RsmB/RsmF family)